MVMTVCIEEVVVGKLIPTNYSDNTEPDHNITEEDYDWSIEQSHNYIWPILVF